MDYSAANQALWNIIIQLGLIAGAMLLANFLRQKLAFIRRSLMPIAVLAGFLLLLAKLVGLVKLDESCCLYRQNAREDGLQRYI